VKFASSILILAICLLICYDCSSPHKKVEQLSIDPDSIELGYSDVRNNLLVQDNKFKCLRKKSDIEVDFYYDKVGSQFLNVHRVSIGPANKNIEVTSEDGMVFFPKIIDSLLLRYENKNYQIFIGIKNDILQEDAIFYMVSVDFGILSTGTLLWNNYAVINLFKDYHNKGILTALVANSSFSLIDHLHREHQEEIKKFRWDDRAPPSIP